MSQQIYFENSQAFSYWLATSIGFNFYGIKCFRQVNKNYTCNFSLVYCSSISYNLRRAAVVVEYPFLKPCCDGEIMVCTLLQWTVRTKPFLISHVKSEISRLRYTHAYLIMLCHHLKLLGNKCLTSSHIFQNLLSVS